MTHLDNLRDPHAIEGLLPWLETVAKSHQDMHLYIMAGKDNQGSRDAFVVRYSNAIDMLRSAIGKVRDLQREATNEVVDKMDEVGQELQDILAPQRMPGTDEHE